MGTLRKLVRKLRRPAPELGKADIIHHLARRYGYRRYLEFATMTTGGFYHLIDPARFDLCCRFMYRCPSDFSDGLGIDWRAPGDAIEPEWSAMAAERRGFDIMLVDTFHTYPEARRDIEAAFALLPAGGAMVVHDCRPPGKQYANPEFHDGPWGGVTYKAFLDFVLARDDLRYATVNTDWGCGVVRKLPKPPEGLWSVVAGAGRRRAVEQWLALPAEGYDAAWALLMENEKALLNRISVAEFLAGRHGL